MAVLKDWKMGHLDQGPVNLSKLFCYPDFSASVCKAGVQILPPHGSLPESLVQCVMEQVTSLHQSDCGVVLPSPPQSSTAFLFCERGINSELVIPISV